MNQLRLLFSMLLITTCLYVPTYGQDLATNPRFENQCANPSAACNRTDALGNVVTTYCPSPKYRVQIASDADPLLYPCSSCRYNIYSTHGFPRYVHNPYSNTQPLVNMECVSNPLSAPQRVPRGQGIWIPYRAFNAVDDYTGGTVCVKVSLAAWKLQPNTGTVLEVWSVKQKSQAQLFFERAGVDREDECAEYNSEINPDPANGFRIGTITENDLGSLSGYASSGDARFFKEFTLLVPSYGVGPIQRIWLKMVSTIPNAAVDPSYMQIQQVNVNVLCTASQIASLPLNPFSSGLRLPDRCFCGVRPTVAVEAPIIGPVGLRMANPNAGETSADQTSLTGDIKVGIDPQTRKLSLQNAPSDLNIEEAKLYDLNGRTVLVSQGPIVDMRQIDLSGIASGFYILTLKTSQGLVRTPISF